MNRVVAVLEHDHDSQVVAAAGAISTLLGLDVSSLHVPPGEPSDRARAVVEALATDDVTVGVLNARGRCPVCWDVITRVTGPVVVVPEGSNRAVRDISRVLLPLDGSLETAAGVADLAHRVLDAGADVVAMHVFEAATVPAFWDQAAHSHTHWTREFLQRNLPEAIELDLRRGRPAEEVLAEADRAGVDLIIIAWGQDLSTGRAATVRRALTHGLVPVLLIGIGPGPSPRWTGPSAYRTQAEPGEA